MIPDQAEILLFGILGINFENLHIKNCRNGLVQRLACFDASFEHYNIETFE